ncbi:MAG: Hemin transport protein [Thermomonas sp.]
MALALLPAGLSPANVPARALPEPRQLAALGAVLCLSRARFGHPLAGWTPAVRAEVACRCDSDGLRESLSFLDRDGQCCWRLYLLPESDFLAWEELSSRLPLRTDGGHAGIAERLLSRLANRLNGGHWQASALRLHALPCGANGTALAASLASLSELGLATARRIARDEGVIDDALGEAHPRTIPPGVRP